MVPSVQTTVAVTADCSKRWITITRVEALQIANLLLFRSCFLTRAHQHNASCDWVVRAFNLRETVLNWWERKPKRENLSSLRSLFSLRREGWWWWCLLVFPIFTMRRDPIGGMANALKWESIRTAWILIEFSPSGKQQKLLLVSRQGESSRQGATRGGKRLTNRQWQ